MKNFIIPALLSIIFLSSCKKDDPVIPNEEELITTLIYRLQPVGSGDIIELKFHDLDGDGGNPPVVETSPLNANTVYNGSLSFLNELQNPAEDITEEVEEEGQEHQVFYVINALLSEIEYEDADLGGNPIGILTTLTTGSASTGTLTIVLRHEPLKPNDGSPEGAGGETDIEVTFDLIIE